MCHQAARDRTPPGFGLDPRIQLLNVIPQVGE
jgi:hypothetical protein